MSVNLWKSFMLQKIPSSGFWGYEMERKRYKMCVCRIAESLIRSVDYHLFDEKICSTGCIPQPTLLMFLL